VGALLLLRVCFENYRRRAARRPVPHIWSIEPWSVNPAKAQPEKTILVLFDKKGVFYSDGVN
jgi:hypothetical protein